MLCHHSFAECFVLWFAIQNAKIKIHRTIIMDVVLYGCETWLLTLRAERRLRLFDNRVLWRIFGCKRVKVAGEWRKLRNELMICKATKYCSGDQIKKNEISLACSTGGASRGEVHTGFWRGNLKDRGHLKELCIDGRVTLNWMFYKSVGSS